MKRFRKKPKYISLVDRDPESFPDVPEEPLIKIIPREEWGAQPAKSKNSLTLPISHVRYNQTRSDPCTSKDHCTSILQSIQKDHMENKGLPDIQYHFMIGGDGTVYEGRGWETKGETHASLEGKDYYDVAYIGTYGKEGPNWEQSVTAQRFLKYAVQFEYLQRTHGLTFLQEIND